MHIPRAGREPLSAEDRFSSERSLKESTRVASDESLEPELPEYVGAMTGRDETRESGDGEEVFEWRQVSLDFSRRAFVV